MKRTAGNKLFLVRVLRFILVSFSGVRSQFQFPHLARFSAQTHNLLKEC
jgi:hypothetical protein